MVAGGESAVDDAGEVLGGPCRLLRDLDDDGVSGEEGGDDGTEEVVELGTGLERFVRKQFMISLQGSWERDVSLAFKFKVQERTYFQLTQAATTPSGSHRTSFFLYIIKKLVGRLSGFRAFSPWLMVHLSFSAVTRISPKLESTRVLPLSRQAAVEMVFWFSRTNLA